MSRPDPTSELEARKDAVRKHLRRISKRRGRRAFVGPLLWVLDLLLTVGGYVVTGGGMEFVWILVVAIMILMATYYLQASAEIADAADVEDSLAAERELDRIGMSANDEPSDPNRHADESDAR